MPSAAQLSRARSRLGPDGHPSAMRVRELLHYDEESGFFFWRVDRANGSIRAGARAGNEITVGDGRVYRQIGIDGKPFYEHSLAVIYVTGIWPPEMVDHRDGDGVNNRWKNLRPASNAVNQHNQRKAPKNSSTGMLGVSRVRRAGKPDTFRAAIRVDTRKIYLGMFDEPSTAFDAYIAAKRQLHEGCLI